MRIAACELCSRNRIISRQKLDEVTSGNARSTARLSSVVTISLIAWVVVAHSSADVLAQGTYSAEQPYAVPSNSNAGAPSNSAKLNIEYLPTTEIVHKGPPAHAPIQIPAPIELRTFAAPASEIYFGTDSKSELPPKYVVNQTDLPNIESNQTPRNLIPEMSKQVDLSTPPLSIMPWWQTELKQPLKGSPDRVQQVELERLIWLALEHSPHVRAILTTPQIRDAEVRQARGVFDPTRFVESIFHDDNNPVGSTLTTGGPSRFKERFLDNTAGVRSKNQYGGQFEAAQDIGLKDNNSLFLVPKQQADTKMAIRYTQPLARGSGTVYNRSSIVVAQIQADLSAAEAKQNLQAHVFDITRAYWDLCYYRAAWLQGQRGLDRLEHILTSIENRVELDGVRSQQSRARAAVSTQRARIQHSYAEMFDAETRLRTLVNAPELQFQNCIELIPSSDTSDVSIPFDVQQELDMALNTRPEVLAIRDQIRAAKLKLKVAEQDLRPTLNLVTEVYMRGLTGDYNVAGSYADQFATGRPSYSGGIVYQRSKYNTAGNSIKQQRSLEIQRLLSELEDRLNNISQDVCTSIVKSDALFIELQAAAQSTVATLDEVLHLASRWQANAIIEKSPSSSILDELMDAESRLIQAENNWALAQTNHMMAIARVRLASGTLLVMTPNNESTE